jgi:hypothetical protein
MRLAGLTATVPRIGHPRPRQPAPDRPAPNQRGGGQGGHDGHEPAAHDPSVTVCWDTFHVEPIRVTVEVTPSFSGFVIGGTSFPDAAYTNIDLEYAQSATVALVADRSVIFGCSVIAPRSTIPSALSPARFSRISWSNGSIIVAANPGANALAVTPAFSNAAHPARYAPNTAATVGSAVVDGVAGVAVIDGVVSAGAGRVVVEQGAVVDGAGGAAGLPPPHPATASPAPTDTNTAAVTRRADLGTFGYRVSPLARSRSTAPHRTGRATRPLTQFCLFFDVRAPL